MGGLTGEGAPMRELTRQDAHDILLGCAVLGTGGGGSLKGGLALVDRAFAAGKRLMLATLDEIPGDEWICVPYMCGSLEPEGGGEAAQEPPPQAKLPPLPPQAPPPPQALPSVPSLVAFETLERYVGRRFYGVMSTELGGGNTAESLYAAAMLGRVAVDADPAGRSVPELQHSTFYLHGLPIAPLAAADANGDAVVVVRVGSDERAEEIVRALAVASGGSVGVADHPATAAQLRGKAIDGAISGALKIGRALRAAREAGEDAAEAVAAAAGGRALFRGRVASSEWETRSGFTFGEFTVRDGPDEYRIWFKNENLIGWLNGEAHAMAPDLICVLGPGGLPAQNPDVAAGMDVAVLALPAPREWTTAKGLEVFGPRHFGFDIDYRPIAGSQ